MLTGETLCEQEDGSLIGSRAYSSASSSAIETRESDLLDRDEALTRLACSWKELARPGFAKPFSHRLGSTRQVYVD